MSLLGKILDIDLHAGTSKFLPFPKELTWHYLGGRGFNVQFLYRHLPADADPLGPENLLLLSCGLLTGTTAPASSRLHINAKSPLTGLLGSSNVGGGFGAQLRACGIQSLIIRGKAPEPVYLWVTHDSVEIRSAKSLWGLDTWQAHEHLTEKLGSRKLKIMTIGPGGENGTLFGCMMTDLDHAAGRTGMGTVMGSKNLKAIVIKGQKKKAPFRARDNGHEAVKRYLWQIKNAPHFKTFKRHGGAGYVKWADDLGIIGTRNFRTNTFEDVDQVDGKILTDKVIRSRGCYRCPVQCKAELEFSDGRLKGQKSFRPEFEPMLALGPKCGLNDLDTLVYLDNLCSRLGIDSISAGNAIAFAMDLFDRQILSLEDTGGLDLVWGQGRSMEVLIKQMASGEGLGGILGKGVRQAARIIGRGAEHYAAHVKGLEMSGYHPDNMMGTALGYAVASRGADFNDVYSAMENKWLPAEHIEEFGKPKASDLQTIHGKAELVRRAMIVSMVLDSLGLCKVPVLSLISAYDLVAETELASVLMDQPVSVADIYAAGERIANTERLFNLRCGASQADDRLPDMFFEKDYNAGQEPSKPSEWMEPMKKEFYRVMGWDEQGRPTAEKLSEIGIVV
ncbi:Tungsten-containing aldehyde:ferredoxin oxidoreductase (EC [Olavius sp. associated proteobacterium Delta 1]|nr:Tungsten-containing aldehyde:ferredoxin oxidoreductase (EC [Olavius sp. associated proteobacterium Delta 1]